MPEPTPTPGSSRSRHTLVGAIVCLATLLAFVGVFAIWANRQLLNTDNWTETSTELLQDGVIRNQLAVYLVDQAYANLDVEAQIAAVLPEQAQALAAPAASGLRNFAEKGANEILSRPRAQTAWTEINRRAHTRLMQVLEGGGDVVSTDNGVVALDLKALLGQTAARIGVGERLEQRLPADAAQIVILRSNQLSTAQDVARMLDKGAPAIVGLAIALYLLAIYLARGFRRVTLRWWGIGFILAGVTALFAKELVGNAVVDSLATTEAVRPAVENAWTIATQMLGEVITATIAYGIVLIAAASLAGPSRAATASRRVMAPYLREPVIAFGSTAVIIMLVTWWSPTPVWRNPITVALLALLLGVGVEALRRLTAREFPDADRAESMARIGAWFAGLGHRSPQPAVAVAAPAGAVVVTPDAESLKLDKLEQLVRLHDDGTLTDADFEAEKALLLKNGTTPRFTR